MSISPSSSLYRELAVWLPAADSLSFTAVMAVITSHDVIIGKNHDTGSLMIVDIKELLSKVDNIICDIAVICA